MNIRTATLEDAEAVSALINGSAHHFMLEPCGHGAQRFLEGISPQAIRGYITNPNFHYLVALAGPALVGAVALREGRHLFHLFVAPTHQRQGLARALWSAVQESAAPEVAFTVNSSPNAVAIYEKFGFAATGPRTEMNGIAFIPMKTVT